jgi:hypothetical protein
MKIIKWVLPCVAVVALITSVIQAFDGSQETVTYGDSADALARECVIRKGYGKWRSSLGVSLEQFCLASAQAVMIERYCREQPESC